MIVPYPCCLRALQGVSGTLSPPLPTGLKEKCVDSLVFETLIPKPMMQHYISLLLKHRRLILSGPSGTGKTYLTNRLAEYLVERSGRDVTEGIVSTFNMHQQSCKVRAHSSVPVGTGAMVPMAVIAAPHMTPGLFFSRIYSCTCPTSPTRLTGRRARRMCLW